MSHCAIGSSSWGSVETSRGNVIAMSGFGTFRTCQPAYWMSALRGKPEVGVGQLDF
jgi:hypothetical protein